MSDVEAKNEVKSLKLLWKAAECRRLVASGEWRVFKPKRDFEGTKMAKRVKKEDLRVDGLSPKDIEKIRKAIRQVWSWSYPRRLCIQRATGPDGFPRCEQCKEKVPKVHPDHIQAVGDVDAGFIKRLFCPSNLLQALCNKCHSKKTNQERSDKRAIERDRNCVEEGCTHLRKSRRFHCEAHYYRLRRNGDVGSTPIGKYERHGKSDSPEYLAWAQMWSRCTDPKHPKYGYYGGRGIKVCPKWRSFLKFFKDMGERPTPKHSIDRINNDGNYTPTNCRWATRSEQMRNRRPRQKKTHQIEDIDFY